MLKNILKLNAASHGLRFYSSKPYEIDKGLKLALNSLYKLVHPDFFHSHPEAKDSNDKSFKLLQEYVDFTKKGFEGGRPLTEYKFTFFIWKDKPSNDDSDGSDGEREAHKVAVSLPPPKKGSPFKNRHAFQKLFVACGVSFDPDQDEGSQDGGAGSRGVDPSDFDGSAFFANLSEREREVLVFMQEAADVIREISADRAKSPQVRVPYLRASMRHSRGLMVSFKNQDEVAGSKQVRLLEQLVDLIDSDEDLSDLDLTGHHVVFGDWLGLDPFGHLCLHTDRPEEWGDFLYGVDLEYSKQRRKRREALRRTESAVAAAAGLWQICAEPREGLRERYSALLQGLAAQAAARGPLRDVDGVTLTVREQQEVRSCYLGGGDDDHSNESGNKIHGYGSIMNLID